MDDWKHVKDEECDWWVNDKIGNIVKLGNGGYKAMIPKIIELGPFSSLEEAKQVVCNNLQSLSLYLQQFNESIVNLTNQIRDDGDKNV